MKKWSTTTKWVVALIVVAVIVIIYMNLNSTPDVVLPTTVGGRRVCPAGLILGFNSVTNQFQCHPYSRPIMNNPNPIA